MHTIGISACSNGQPEENRSDNEKLVRFLEETGHSVKISPWIYGKQGSFSASGKQRAEALMDLFLNPDIEEIYDISGGDMANEVLDFLNYEKIAASQAMFWGYSDITTVINAIYAKTGKPGVLYSVRNLVHGEFQDLQRQRYLERESLFAPKFTMLQGKGMEGITVGGNIRCFLKLAGTEYFPDLTDKLLVLEARSGGLPQMVTCLTQLKSLGAFQKVRGILLGTFSQMEREQSRPEIFSLVREFAGDRIPIAKTEEIGHGPDSRAIHIGKPMKIS